ncbi:MAG: rhodanese-like domain-containing protein [Chloroflexi bacterium]|nr:rhodanese-like domain-containing protein [Chloroflexota bacterium]
MRQAPMPEEPFERIDVERAKEMIERKEVQIIDVREEWEYERGHIPGAKLIPLNVVLSKPREVLEGDHVLFVCGVGERSAVACEMAAAVGLKHLYNLEGGTMDWIKKGYPVDR